MRYLLVRASVVAAVVAAVTTGCSNPPTPPERAPTQAEQLRISDATEILIQQCMNRAGFSYWTSPRLGLEESRSTGFVNDDVEWAQKHGYGSRIRDKEDRARRANPNGTYRAGLSPQRRTAYDKALDGGRSARILTTEIPGGGSIRKRLGGCVEVVEKELYGDPARWFRAEKLAANLRPLYVPALMRDGEFGRALAAWAACMRRSGHAYPDPPAARDAVPRLSTGVSPDRAFAFEVSIAVAEARCARETSLKDIGRKRESHYAGALRDRYGDAVDTYRRLQHDAYNRATRITGPRV
ncbi:MULTISPECIES: hypothetical protein [unclassified Streptomyces]|uniref:hypothetical protein n=1 Tax=unclassified Streptomyces TaxID=2593676 RepID=UPI0006F8E76E|nr:MULTISPECIES: hypothetical protein [unclassified Streptomyces]KQX59075.1 hypothetical protein ASD33_01870 [Streptomyces sp. Root1304]KRB00337.1 hypothetical protein ASE09_01870 [Streptomyces sp. Root66D1]